MTSFPNPLHRSNDGGKTTARHDDIGDGSADWFMYCRLAALEKAEDDAAVSGDMGILMLAIRRDTPVSDVAAGDYTGLHVDALGRLRVMDGNIPGYPPSAVPVAASSGNVANAAAVAAMAATPSVTNYASGFTITAAGATAASVVVATLAGVLGGTLSYVFAAPAGATVLATPLHVRFGSPVPASAVNTALTLTLPALGVGNTNAAVSLHGFRV